MIIEILLILLGLGLLVYGSNILVDGASAVARKFGVSDFVIGLTIVGFGTSCPELVVSLTGALEGSGDIAIGNVVGSNIFNTLFILGLTALLSPVAITEGNRRRDIPMMIVVTLFFVLVAWGRSGVDRVDGIFFLVLFALFIIYSFKTGKTEDTVEEQSRPIALPLAVLMIAGGLAGLIFGGQLFVNNAVSFAERIGVSQKFIAVTLLAGGTSLPELVTSIVAVAKKKGQMALGNIIGSNIFNILFILGCSSVISPLHSSGISAVDLGVLALSALMMLFAYIGKGEKKITRVEGAVMVACFVAYMVYLAVNP